METQRARQEHFSLMLTSSMSRLESQVGKGPSKLAVCSVPSLHLSVFRSCCFSLSCATHPVTHQIT